MLALLVLSALAAEWTASKASHTQAQVGVSVTFLANEGVLLSSGSRKVLIDGLFLRYGDGFAMPADSTQRALASARPPFDAVDVVLVTHRHGDHFHPAPIAAHLLANPRARLVTSQQVVDSLLRFPGARVALPPSRFLTRTTAAGARRREVINGVPIEILGIPHGGGWRNRSVQHLGYIVELGGRRVLHVGDTDINESTFEKLRLDTARIDVALLPQWLVTSTDGAAVIRKWIRPRQVVAMHVGDGQGARADAEVRAAFPGALTFARSLETRRW